MSLRVSADARFDNVTGFKLVDFQEVGLPIYRLNTVALFLQRKTFGPIEEFIMRAVAGGLETVEDVTGLLGIDKRVVEATLTSLIQEDLVYLKGATNLALTAKSKAILDGELAVRPKEQATVFFFDALIRRPIHIDPSVLLAPSDLKDLGYGEIRAYPARKPEPHEIEVSLLDAVVSRDRGTQQNDMKLLRVREIGRREFRFQPAVMLIYRSERGSDVRVEFAIDGRVSEEHGNSFLLAKGPEKMGIVNGVLASSSEPQLSQVLGAKLAKEVSSYGSSGEAASALRREAALAKFRAEISKRRRAKATPDESDPPVTPSKEQGEVEVAEATLKTLPVRPIAVYEHPPLLRNALETSKARLLILSPWITPAVVDKAFVLLLRRALERGVRCHIGFGIEGQHDVPKNDAISRLEHLARQFPSLAFQYLGDTHAKVLLKDSEFFVVSSFNWLSFRGSPDRTFREEWGTYVGVSPLVDNYARDLLLRFERASVR